MSTVVFFFFYGYGNHRDLPPFPPRRSSDLADPPTRKRSCPASACVLLPVTGASTSSWPREAAAPASSRTHSTVTVDRKSTRLNSSHANISYAVFCLKKKKSTTNRKTV